jgi:hypothetical protein
MVYAMGGYPEYGPALQIEGSEDGKHVFQPQRQPVGTMRVQPMIAEADSQTCRYPVKENSFKENLPAEHEQSGDGADMK